MAKTNLNLNERTFDNLDSKRISEMIARARHTVVYVAPGMTCEIAKAILDFCMRHENAALDVIIDCSEEVCRMGYGEVQAVRLLTKAGYSVRQSSSLRIGVLICDEHAWCFSPTPLSIEEEASTPTMPNAVALLPQQAHVILQALRQQAAIPESLFDDLTSKDSYVKSPEIGATALDSSTITNVENGLEVAPPLQFDVMRQVSVFQPYIQYVELSLTGCSFKRHTVQIPPDIIHLAEDNAVKERLRTTFKLISESSGLSDKELQSDLEEIRKIFTRSLGKPWGRVILRNQRQNLDERVQELRKKVAVYQAQIKKQIVGEIENSIADLMRTFSPQLQQNPPEHLLYQIAGDKPTPEEANRWLYSILKSAFPHPEEVINDIELEVTFKDVTYESLNHPGLKEALQRAYPALPWDKPFEQFKAAEARKP